VNGPGGVLDQRHRHRRGDRVEIDELGLILVDPLPSSVWYRDMADFADGISDGAAGRRLTQSWQGRPATNARHSAAIRACLICVAVAAKRTHLAHVIALELSLLMELERNGAKERGAAGHLSDG